MSWFEAIYAHRVVTRNVMVTVPSKGLTNVCAASIHYVSASTTLIDVFATFFVNWWSHYRSRFPFRRFESWWWYMR